MPEFGPTSHELAGELGYAPPSASLSHALPPGGGKLILPHISTFSQVVNLASRTYRWAFDEALRNSQTNTLAMRRDLVVMDALRSRQIPVVQLAWHLDPVDDTNNREMEAVKKLTRIIQDIPRFQTYLMLLQEAIWYGRYGIQNIFSWDYATGERRLVVRGYKPINGDKLIFRHSGQVGVLVHPAHYDGTRDYTDRGMAHFLTPEEREQLVLHQHEPEDADFFEAELAGGIHGVGIRSRIYWLWWLKSQVLAFLMDYLERVGAGGFTIYFYESGNEESLKEVKEAAEYQWRNNSILFPRYRDNSTGGPGIMRVEASSAGASLLESLVVGYFDNLIRRYILGQSLTSEAHGTGMGSGVADLHADTFTRIVKFDAVNLQETLTSDLIGPLAKYNTPGVTPPRFVFDVDKPNAAELMEGAKNFYEMGGSVDEDELRGILGLAKPAPGHGVLAKAGALQPAGVGAIPQGVPMEGQPGPVLQQMSWGGRVRRLSASESKSPSVLYHYSPVSNRQSIGTHGLSITKDQTGLGGVFLLDRLDHSTKSDVWKVDVSGLDLADDWTYDPADPDEGGRSWIHFNDIPPERLTLITPEPALKPTPMSRRGVVVKYAAKEVNPTLLAIVQELQAGYQPITDYRPVNVDRAKRIADYYQSATHSPQDPKVARSYAAMKKETLAQFKHLQSRGIVFEPWVREGQPYANSQEMVDDVARKHLYYFPTEAGFGSGENPKDHPLLEKTGIKVGNQDLTYNDAFRAVHDVFGHALHGNQFGPRGEEHAWRVHRGMYSPEAQPAMSFETRGQNSWVNFGPHSQQPVTSRPYAEQKANILPADLMEE